MYSNNFTDEQVNFAKAAFSNLIGGISYFYGSSKYVYKYKFYNYSYLHQRVQSPDLTQPVVGVAMVKVMGYSITHTGLLAHSTIHCCTIKIILPSRVPLG